MVNTSQTGTWSELLSAAWLMERGYQVYMGLGNTTCDLIAVDITGASLRVEVKKASAAKNRYVVTVNRPGAYDLLLVVFPDGTVRPAAEVRDVCTGIP